MQNFGGSLQNFGGGNKADYVEMLNDKNFIDFFYVWSVTVSEISPNTGIAFLCRAVVVYLPLN